MRVKLSTAMETWLCVNSEPFRVRPLRLSGRDDTHNRAMGRDGSGCGTRSHDSMMYYVMIPK